MELTKSQSVAVDELVEATKMIFEDETTKNIKNIINFKAPTGSGKTFMISNYIDKVMSEFSHHKLIFWITTLSQADLSGQFANDIKNYNQYLVNKNMDIEAVISPSSTNSKSKSAIDAVWKIYAYENRVYVSGISSFGKKRIFTEEGVLDAFLDEIREQGYKLIYIRDEAHHGGEVKKSKKEDSNHFEYLMQQNAFVVLKMTATPNSSDRLIELKEKDLLNDDVVLIKSQAMYNQNIDQDVLEIDNNQILNIACKKFNEIKKEYSDHDKEPELVGINPAMLIQVDNKTKLNEDEFDQNINELIKIIESHNLTWVKYFGDTDKDSNMRMKDNFNLRDISKNSSAADVIIFKIGPATGWNIPRACMLVQLRNVSSSTLDTQTLGRIKRNPNPKILPNDYKNSIASKYFVYSNNEPKNNNYESYYLKESYYEEDFISGYIDEEIKETPINNGKYLEAVKELISEEYANPGFYHSKVENYFEFFKDKKFIVLETKRFGDLHDQITRKAYNSIDLELYILQLKRQNKKLLPRDLINFINTHFHKMLESNEITKNIDLLWLIFFKEILFHVKEKYKDIIDYYKEKNNFYKIQENVKLPKQLDLINNNDDESKKIKLNKIESNFAYLKSVTKSFEKFDFQLNLDSNPEVEFVKLIQKNKEKFVNKKVKVWTKNPVHQGVLIQYLDNNNETYSSFPDFIIKTNNHLVYIEVKDFNDINPQKTSNLKDAYSEYINKINDHKNGYTFLIAKYNKPTNSFDFEGNSSIEILNNKLNENQKLDLFQILFEYS